MWFFGGCVCRIENTYGSVNGSDKSDNSGNTSTVTNDDEINANVTMDTQSTSPERKQAEDCNNQLSDVFYFSTNA